MTGRPGIGGPASALAARVLRAFGAADPRRLWIRYVSALTVIVVLIAGASLIERTSILAARNDARDINISGRQRMLSQRILFFSELYRNSGDPADRAALTDTIDEFAAAHVRLSTSPDLTDALVRIYFDPTQGPSLDALVDAFVADARSLVTDAPTPGAIDRMRAVGPNLLLTLLDDAVTAFEARSVERSHRLLRLERLSLIAAVVTIVLEALFIFRPGHRLATGALMQLERRNRALARNERLLESRNRALESMLYVLTHDLKGPVLTIDGFAERVRRRLSGADAEAVDGMLRKVTESTGQMYRLINAILELVRLDAVAAPQTVVDLDRLVAEVESGLSEQLSAAGARLVVSPLPAVRTNAMLLGQVIRNVVSNAIKYGCPAPGMEVELFGERHGDQVRISVRDAGPGIDAEFHEKVFELFQRLPSPQPGLGLGLSLVRKIVEMLGGTVGLESAIGRGTTVWISVPAATPGGGTADLAGRG